MQPSSMTRWLLIVLALLISGGLLLWWIKPGGSSEDRFMVSMAAGKKFLDVGQAERAVEAFQHAVELEPAHPDAHLNLANAHLLAGQSEPAIEHARKVLELEEHSAAAFFVEGCAHIRLGQYEEALKALQQSTELDPTVAAAFFQLGVAHQQLRQWNEAISAFQIAVQLDPNHPAAHYNLSQSLIRAGRPEEANEELELHRQILSLLTNQPPATAATYERSKHTQARVPFRLEQPDPKGIPVKFVEATQTVFAPAGGGTNVYGPAGMLDVWRDGFYDLFVRDQEGFRILMNTNGVFQPMEQVMPNIPEAVYTKSLVGDLNHNITPHDRMEDVIVLGLQGTHVFRVSTNGMMTDLSMFSRLNGLQALGGALVDLDFTGKLDLVAVTRTNEIRVFRNLASMLFRDITATSGVPASLSSAEKVVVDDWQNDDLMDVFVVRAQQPPLLLAKQRGGPLVETNLVPDLPATRALMAGDLNNDLRTDLVLATAEGIEVIFGGLDQRLKLPPPKGLVRHLQLFDYDNDGWLDLWGLGSGVAVWRNAGPEGFKEVTQELGFGGFDGDTHAMATADFDMDGDSDLLLDLGPAGLRYFRNDGGNANYQIKVHLAGNRSNPSGIGVRVELNSGGFRAIRTVRELPVEIGVGKHRRLDSLAVRWFDLVSPTIDVDVDPKSFLTQTEMILPTGSCPYLYAWDGERFRFVTDFLGAAPMGLPVAEGVYIDADVDEYIWMGDDSVFRPRGEEYLIQITEELREVLYLDEVRLAVVDHPPGTEIYPTDKLLPGKPFPPSELKVLHREKPLLNAARLDGKEVTDLLRAHDQKMVSPLRLRAPQLRGLAEPHGVILDFGEIETSKPLVLALTGWLRFGGGMANIAASHDPDLPFPFPTLEVETSAGGWQPVDVRAGAPAGKTKRMMIDLTGKLPPGSRRLKLSAAFEIHWDHITLFEKADASLGRVTELYPKSTDLHWRGFSEYTDLPWDQPLTPDYERVHQNANWRIAITGWCTRYGPVDELLMKRDDALVMINAGDELTVTFDASRVPPKPEGYKRNFYLYTVGWEKDADFHVVTGTTIEPLPFHGMDDQLYGRISRPVIDGDWWIPKYNTRWVGAYMLRREPLGKRIAERESKRQPGL